jgi:DNA mismatch endonuclease (patch repair protein)
VIFVNGCFWHGHKECKYFVWPKTNSDFWEEKIKANILRDAKKIEMLKLQGWKVIVVWECELKNSVRKETLEKIKQQICL